MDDVIYVNGHVVTVIRWHEHVDAVIHVNEHMMAAIYNNEHVETVRCGISHVESVKLIYLLCRRVRWLIPHIHFEDIPYFHIVNILHIHSEESHSLFLLCSRFKAQNEKGIKHERNQNGESQNGW